MIFPAKVPSSLSRPYVNTGITTRNGKAYATPPLMPRKNVRMAPPTIPAPLPANIHTAQNTATTIII